MKLPFLFLSVVLIPLVNAQGNFYVSEHNLTYYLGEEDFKVVEDLVFENPGDPFTYEGGIYFMRGDAEDVKLEGFPYSLTQGQPRMINLEFMISKGQKKRVSITYKRTDLLSEKNGVTVFEGLSLGKYSWPVHRARITFVAPPKQRFGSISPLNGRIQRGENETLYYEVSVFENVSAVLDGFPVRIEYADYKSLAKREIQVLSSLLAEAEFEAERANSSLGTSYSYGVNVSKALEPFNRSVNALLDGREKLSFSRVNYEAGEYYGAYSFAMTAGNLLRVSIKEASLARELVNLELQSQLERKTSQAENQSRVVEAEPVEVGDSSRRVGFFPVFLAIALGFAALVFAFFLFRKKTRRPLAQDFASIKDLKRKKFKGFEKKVNGVKRRAEKSAEIRGLIRERGVVEEELEGLHKKRVRKKVGKKAFEAARKKLLRKLDVIDSRKSRRELELEKMKQESKRG